MKSIFEEMGGTYTLGEDGMYSPDFRIVDRQKNHTMASMVVCVKPT